MKTSKNPLQRQNSPFNRSAGRFLQRSTLWVIVAGAVAFQVSGCDLRPRPLWQQLQSVLQSPAQ
jgi:hypothetical protein